MSAVKIILLLLVCEPIVLGSILGALIGSTINGIFALAAACTLGLFGRHQLK